MLAIEAGILMTNNLDGLRLESTLFPSGRMIDMTILSVDSDEVSRQVTTELLRREGFGVVEAENGLEALGVARTAQPRLVLLNVDLPDISGQEVVRRLKDDQLTSSIPILQTSATPESAVETRSDGLRACADAYLLKPVEPQELIATIRALLRMKEAEEAHRESEARYQLLFEGNSLPTWIFDVETLKFVAVNEAAVSQYGYGRDEFLSISLEQLRPALSVPGMEDYLRLNPRGIPNGAQWRHLKKDGTALEVEAVWYEIIYRGRHSLLVMAKDVTERKRSEAEREELLRKEKQARKEAQAANRAKDEFLAVVSHELRAPLNAMLGWARILKSTSVDETTLRHAIEIIERSARTQSKLIEDLLDTARISSGKLRIDVQPVNLAVVIDSAAEVLRPAAEAKEIQINLSLGMLTEVITGDPDRLQQIVWNLMSNAIKFTPNGGRVDVKLLRADPHVRIIVSDTGRGIEPQQLPYIFNRFQQADGAGTRRTGGLGLGLALVRDLVELHGGTVYAESEGLDRGATFTVNLPLRAVRPALPEPDLFRSFLNIMDHPAALRGVRVLVVDDEADARDLVTALLQQYGAVVTAVDSARAAMSVLHAGEPGDQPDVLISDISMPDEDGYQLIRKVRMLPEDRGGRIIAIALTAYGRSVDRIRALSSGFQMHLPKPVEPAELVTVVASLVGGTYKTMKAP